MKERIQKYMDFKNISAGELANRLEVQRSNISHILNGRNKPSAAFIEKMLNVFPDLDARWLLTGEGEMIDSEDSVITVSQEKDQTKEALQAPIDIQPTVEESQINQESRKAERRSSQFDDSIHKIVLFYKDGTFTSFSSRKRE